MKCTFCDGTGFICIVCLEPEKKCICKDGADLVICGDCPSKDVEEVNDEC